MIRRLFEKLRLIKPRQPHLPQTNVSGSFKEWYLEFRNEMAKSFGVNYSISIASWTFSENHKHYYDRGLTPKEAVLEYAASKNCHQRLGHLRCPVIEKQKLNSVSSAGVA